MALGPHDLNPFFLRLPSKHPYGTRVGGVGQGVETAAGEQDPDSGKFRRYCRAKGIRGKHKKRLRKVLAERARAKVALEKIDAAT